MTRLLGLLAGIVAGAAAMMIVGYVGTALYPIHAAEDSADANGVIEVIRAASAGAQAVILVSWFAGAFAGAAVAKLVSGRRWPGWTIAGILAALLAFIFFLPLPIWMQTLAPIAPLLGGAAADILIARRGGEEAPEAQV